jgi:hypothetical protein
MAADGYLSSCRAITMRWMWPVPPQIRVTAKAAAGFRESMTHQPHRRQHIQHGTGPVGPPASLPKATEMTARSAGAKWGRIDSGMATWRAA